MTTDNFTEAAHTEADDRFLIDPDHPGQVTKEWIAIFEQGAVWARTHLAAQEPSDGEEVVRELHTPREEQVLTGDCSIEECDHEDECPTEPFTICTECWRVADEADTYFAERGVGHVAYPCPTIRALDIAAKRS